MEVWNGYGNKRISHGGRSMIWKMILLAAIVAFVLLMLVGVIDGNRFVVKEEQFELPKLKKSCRFVMISDLHNKVYGRNNEKIIKAVEEANPDFVVIAGDLITSHVNEPISPGVDLINALSKHYQIYYALGNHETKLKLYPEKFGNMYDRLVKEIEHPNVKLLVDESCVLPEYSVCLTGLELERAYFARFKKKDMEQGHLEKHIGKANAQFCNILIAHNPEYFKEYADWGADFVLSGHVHGGIMRLPLLGGVISPSYKLFPKYDGGVFREGKSTMLLGRGMGSHTLPFRFFNPAELLVVTLK